jgi:hypothetical protein
MAMMDSRVPAAPRGHGGDSERYVGRALALLWVFWFVEFWPGQVLGALAGPVVATLAVLVTVALAGYALWHWERIAAWVMVACGLVWPVAFPLVVSAGGGENVLAVTVVTFVLFALPALVAAGLILDGERRLAKRSMD